MKQTRYCLSKAITADPEDVSLRYQRASIYIELGDYQKAAESYEQIARRCPNDVEVLKKAVQVSASILPSVSVKLCCLIDLHKVVVKESRIG